MSSEGEPTRDAPRSRSLRRRIAGWTVAVFGATLAILTAAAVVEERSRILGIEAASARSLLAHLSEMPELSGGRDQARAAFAAIRQALAAAGSSIDLVPAGSPPAPAGTELARRAVALREGPYELRYRADPVRLAAFARRSILVHAALGVLTLAALLGGTEWILRRKLLGPLHQISHQVNHMQRGGGWIPLLPPTDAEISELAGAVKGLGPALEDQVRTWIEAERRAAVSLALSELRGRLLEPQRRALALLGDLQASGLVRPSAKPRVRAVIADIERISREIEARREAWLAPAANGPDGAGPAVSPWRT